MWQDRPTLHLGEHHLLHGKFAALQRPYAVIRRVYGDPTPTTNEASGDGVDTSSESSGDEDGEIGEPSKRLKQRAGEEEEDGPLFPDIHTTPHHSRTNGKPNGHVPSSSSPFYPPSTPLDYSSDLDASSPARDWQVDQFGEPQNGDEEDKEDDEDARERREVEGMRVKRDESRAKVKARRKREEKERTRHYEVVGVVRKKVVFALRWVRTIVILLQADGIASRPEPIVTATVLPD